MKEITNEELKVLQLDILAKVDEFCRKNNISYTLIFGTLIGAIRHKGYIPWDDDIDIAMPRPSYDRFLETFNGYDTYLYVIAPETNINYYAPYANVCDRRTILYEGYNGHRGIEVGVKIDIFPIDGTPEDETEYVKRTMLLDDYRTIMRWKRNKLQFYNLKLLLITIAKKLKYSLYSYESLQNKILTEERKYPFSNSKYVDNVAFPVYSNTRLPKCCFDKYIDVHFENKLFMVIESYDEYLTKVYGDYMQLPPEEKRIPHHGFTAYWK